MASDHAQSIAMTCDICGIELRPESSFCHECGNSLSMTSSWPNRPLLNIWFRPRVTIRAIIDSEPEKYVLLLAFLAGIVRAFDLASEMNYGDTLPFAGILLIAVGLGGAGGWISLFLSGAVLRWTGSCRLVVGPPHIIAADLDPFACILSEGDVHQRDSLY